MNNEKKVREPLFHIAKRGALPWHKAWGIRGLSILAALIFAGVVAMLLTGENPLAIYGTMIKGCFSSERRIWMLLQTLVMLLCVSLAVTPAFKCAVNPTCLLSRSIQRRADSRGTRQRRSKRAGT